MGDRPLDNYHYLQLPETDQWGLILKKEDPLSQKEFILPEDLLGTSPDFVRTSFASSSIPKMVGKSRPTDEYNRLD